MRVSDFRVLAVERSATVLAGAVVVAASGGLWWDVVDVRTYGGNLVLEIQRRERSVPVTRRPRKRKRSAA